MLSETVIPVLVVIVAFILVPNDIMFYKYLKKRYPKIIEKYKNKKSVIDLPFIINRDIRWYKYLFSINDKDKTIRMHKIISVICILSFFLMFFYLIFIEKVFSI